MVATLPFENGCFYITICNTSNGFDDFLFLTNEEQRAWKEGVERNPLLQIVNES